VFYISSILAGICFLTHVGLLIASFGRTRFYHNRYFYSHITLWATGLMTFLLAVLYGGGHLSTFVDYFDTPVKKGSILLVTLFLSLLAHIITTRLVSTSDMR